MSLSHVFLLLYFIPGISFSQDLHDFKNPLWNMSEKISHCTEWMEKGEIIYTYPMRDFLNDKHKVARFNNEVHYGIIQYQNNFVAVVLKPKDEDDKSAAIAEKVAYDIYEALISPYTGHHFIPPTIVRTFIDGRVASCQYFVETDDLEDMWNESYRTHVFQYTPHDIIQELAIFNAVFNDWDRHPGNYLGTFSTGIYQLANIDNESIENKGILAGWGQRNYIAILFTEDSKADIDQEFHLQQDISLEEFKSFLINHGFEEVPRMTSIYNNLFSRGRNEVHSYYIRQGILFIRYHHGNNAAYPLPKAPYPNLLIETYAKLNKQLLQQCLSPLIELNSDRFSHCISDILDRRDIFLNHARLNRF